MTDLPVDEIELAKMLESIVIARLTGGAADEESYQAIRRGLMSNPTIKPLLPAFIRASRDLHQIWAAIGTCTNTYRERRNIVREGFRPLFDHLEGANRAPADAEINDTLATFDADGVHAVWEKAINRRVTDPDGAITAARTLLESVCKRILEAESLPYDDKAELPKLYSLVADHLKLSPAQHTEETFKAILGSCNQIVNRLGSLRNQIGDAHAQGGRPVRPAPRHAALAVNLSGAMSTFLVETYKAAKER